MINIIYEKVGILKIKKQADIYGHRKCEHEFSPGFVCCAVHPGYQVKVKQGGKENDKDKFWCAPGVKEDTANQDDGIFIAFVNTKIHQHKNW